MPTPDEFRTFVHRMADDTEPLDAAQVLRVAQGRRFRKRAISAVLGSAAVALLLLGATQVLFERDIPVTRMPVNVPASASPSIADHENSD